MTGVPIQRMAERVAELMEERLRIKGQGLAEKLRNGGRKLPRKVRLAAESLRASAELAQNPKLLLQVDQEATAQAYDTCLRYLGKLKGRTRRGDAAIRLATSVAFSLLAVAAILIGVMVWRGYL